MLITLAYVYLFGVVGTVESMPNVLEDVSDTEETSAATTAATTTTAPPVTVSGEQTVIAFPDYTSLDISNPAKPFALNSAATYPAGYTDPPIETPATEDGEPEATTTEDDAYHIDVGVTADTSTTTEATSQTTTTTTTVSTAKEEAPLDDPEVGSGENGTLTVYYTGSGGNVTGDAANILAQVVMGEIGGSFNEEAIKAQAVAAYTYIKYYNDNGNVPYVAVRTPNDTVKRCVNEVIGQMVYYNGSPIQAVYSASSAGYTASAANVWGVNYPYLISVRCELDALYDPNYGAKATFTSTEIKNYVQNATGIVLEGDPGTWFAIKEYVDNVYVGTLSIGGKTSYTDSNGNTVNITGRVLREKILDFNLRSSSFDVSYSADTDKFTFTTYGYGHGVGLSQHGANNLATYWGYDYRQILQFYYPGTEVR